MSMIDKTTALADGFRSLYGTTDKYTFTDMKTALSGLQIKNFFDEGQLFNSSGGDTKDLTGLTVDAWNKYLIGKTVTFSCDIEWTGFNSSGKRFGFEMQTTADDGTQHWNGPWLRPTTPSGSTHLTITQSLYAKAIKSIDSCRFYNQLNKEASAKVTNIKMVINPVEGDK